MDHRLVAWARAVKRRHATGLPPLWLFTDPHRLPDPCAAAARLPRGLCGIVLRHAVPRSVAHRLRQICRERRLLLAVAGDWRLAAALGAGLHLRGGRRPAHAPRWLRAATSSAHGRIELRRARRAGAPLIFLSPVFVTASHPGAPGLGACRWAALAGSQPAAGLGGIDGSSVRLLPRGCVAVGAIGALA